MTIYHSDSAKSFATRTECWAWIKSRVIRFQRIVHHSGSEETAQGLIVASQRGSGKIFDPASPEYKKTALDEPLTNYAKPERVDGRWQAVVRLR